MIQEKQKLEGREDLQKRKTRHAEKHEHVGVGPLQQVHATCQRLSEKLKRGKLSGRSSRA